MLGCSGVCLPRAALQSLPGSPGVAPPVRSAGAAAAASPPPPAAQQSAFCFTALRWGSCSRPARSSTRCRSLPRPAARRRCSSRIQVRGAAPRLGCSDRRRGGGEIGGFRRVSSAHRAALRESPGCGKAAPLRAAPRSASPQPGGRGGSGAGSRRALRAPSGGGGAGRRAQIVASGRTGRAEGAVRPAGGGGGVMAQEERAVAVAAASSTAERPRRAELGAPLPSSVPRGFPVGPRRGGDAAERPQWPPAPPERPRGAVEPL